MPNQQLDDARTDEEIIHLSLAEPELFTIVFLRSVDDIYSFFRRRCSECHSEDLVSEVYLRCFRSRASFDDRQGAFRGWLFGIATNVVHEFYREAARARVVMEEREGYETEVEIIERLDAAADHERLRQAVLDLPELDRAALELRVRDGLTYEQIAEQVAVPIGTVRSRIARARSRVLKQVTPTIEVVG